VRIRYTKRALNDLARIEAYTKKHSPGGAARIGARLRDRVDDLLQFPDQAPVGERRGLRQLFVSRTPYIVIYRVRTDIEIVTIVHVSQRRRS